MFAQLSLRRSPLMVGTAAVLLSFGATAHAQFNPSSARASMGGSGGQGLHFSFGGGMTSPTGEMHRTAASDLDEPTDANDNDLEFEGSLGTAVMLGMGLDMGGGMQLGLEGSFIGHNFNEEDVTYDSTEYESEASATSLGAMITTAYQVDLNNQFSVTPMAGLGFFRNTGSGEIKFGTTTQEYDEHTRYSLGYAFGLGVGMALSDRSKISVSYRYHSSGDASSGYIKGSNSGDVLNFGTLTSHQGTLQASFGF